MTVKQLIEKTTVPVIITDGLERYTIPTGGLIYNTFGDCVINDIQPSTSGNELEITLKTQLVRE